MKKKDQLLIMSKAPLLITDLKPDVNVWKIVIRLVDVWVVREHNRNQHLEAILQDAKENQIHVITRNRELDMWKQTLLEYQTYMVYNGEPLINGLSLKLCDNKLKLFFNGTTAITSIDMRKIPLYKFMFKPFTEFLNEDFDVDHLYAYIIGVLHKVART